MSAAEPPAACSAGGVWGWLGLVFAGSLYLAPPYPAVPPRQLLAAFCRWPELGKSLISPAQRSAPARASETACLQRARVSADILGLPRGGRRSSASAGSSSVVAALCHPAAAACAVRLQAAHGCLPSSLLGVVFCPAMPADAPHLPASLWAVLCLSLRQRQTHLGAVPARWERSPQSPLRDEGRLRAPPAAGGAHSAPLPMAASPAGRRSPSTA